jgi:hypothetical protein
MRTGRTDALSDLPSSRLGRFLRLDFFKVVGADEDDLSGTEDERSMLQSASGIAATAAAVSAMGTTCAAGASAAWTGAGSGAWTATWS